MFLIGALIKINSKKWRQKYTLRRLNISMVLKRKEQCPTFEKSFLSKRGIFPIVLKHMNRRYNYLIVQELVNHSKANNIQKISEIVRD